MSDQETTSTESNDWNPVPDAGGQPQPAEGTVAPADSTDENKTSRLSREEQAAAEDLKDVKRVAEREEHNRRARGELQTTGGTSTVAEGKSNMPNSTEAQEQQLRDQEERDRQAQAEAQEEPTEVTPEAPQQSDAPNPDETPQPWRPSDDADKQ